MYRGEIFVLLGGSGSGKTTLLKQVLGLAKPDAGTILVNGVDITACAASELAAVRRRIGVAFQGSALFSSMTIAENVALPLQELTQLADPIIALMVWMKLKAVGLELHPDHERDDRIRELCQLLERQGDVLGDRHRTEQSRPLKCDANASEPPSTRMRHTR